MGKTGNWHGVPDDWRPLIVARHVAPPELGRAQACLRRRLDLQLRSLPQAHPEVVIGMSVGLEVLISLISFLSAALLIGLFIWAAMKDGEEDKALQARLGIRRKTRLGR